MGDNFFVKNFFVKKYFYENLISIFWQKCSYFNLPSSSSSSSFWRIFSFICSSMFISEFSSSPHSSASASASGIIYLKIEFNKFFVMITNDKNWDGCAPQARNLSSQPQVICAYFNLWLWTSQCEEGYCRKISRDSYLPKG